ncbi:hypothetical protein FJZ53_02200 [Candidatus Woesearchaeota archaeon]|nr:hypothetical protein [Candidatus Woesearchaeota archaeon]
MKVPDSFVPGTGLEEKVSDLEQGKKDDLKLNLLVISPELIDKCLMRYKEPSELARSYPAFNAGKVEGFESSWYNLSDGGSEDRIVFVDVIQFKDEASLESESGKIKDVSQRREVVFYSSTLVKGKYLVFVFAFKKGAIMKDGIVDIYKSDFKFEDMQ